MNFRNWNDVGNFPGIREFTNSHAFVEETGQPLAYGGEHCAMPPLRP